MDDQQISEEHSEIATEVYLACIRYGVIEMMTEDQFNMLVQDVIDCCEQYDPDFVFAKLEEFIIERKGERD